MPSSTKELEALSKEDLIKKVREVERAAESQKVSNSLDMLEKNEAKEQLKLAAQYKENTEKMALLGEMSGNMAHEINNPLLVLNGYVGKLKKYMLEESPDRAKMEKAVERVDSMAKRIQFIIKGILKFSRSNTNEMDFTSEKIKVILDDTIVLCDHKLKRACIKLNVEDFDEDLEIECAQIQVSQVILNLLGNSHDAIKDMKDPWINIKVEDLGDNIKIQLTDCGKGIPMHVQQKLFDRGFTTKGIGVGTGLGLALSRDLIEAHNGSLAIDNNSENTRFVIILPKKYQKLKAG